MQVTKQNIQGIFNKLKLEVRSTGHQYAWLMHDGKKILRVHMSHGKGDIPGRISDKIRGQLRLNKDDFLNLIKCPLSLDQYLDILRQKGLLE